MIIKALALFATFALTGLLAIVGWQDVLQELPNYLMYSATFDCTFVCGSRLVEGFWAVAVVSTLFSLTSVSSLVGMLLLQHRRG